MSTAVRNQPRAYSEEEVVSGNVLAELEAILSSEEFRGSQRSQDFLRYIVGAFYRGDKDSLKERTLGIEIFGRSPNYDTGADAIVRVTAYETRRRLTSYQLAHRDRPVSITMKPGTYIPTIELRAVEPPQQILVPEQESIDQEPRAGLASSQVVELPAEISRHKPSLRHEPLAATETQQEKSRRGITPWVWAVSAGLLLTLCLGVGWRVFQGRNSVVKSFWKPLLSDKKVIICTSKPNAYAIGHQAVVGGDSDLALRLKDMLGSLRQSNRMAIDSDLSENDFREAPVVLVGSSGTNRWSANAANGFRFQFDTMGDRPVIRDVQNPGRIWEVPERPDVSHASKDYAVITRIRRSQFGQGLITIAGSSSLSTHASGVALLTPETLSFMLKDAPDDWSQKNLQLVIRFSHAHSVDYAPQVIAAVYW